MCWRFCFICIKLKFVAYGKLLVEVKEAEREEEEEGEKKEEEDEEEINSVTLDELEVLLLRY